MRATAPRPKMRGGSRRLAPRRLVVRLDAIPDLRLERHAIETVDLLHACRRGHVDLGEIISDHIDADEDQATPRQFGPDDLANLAVALGELALHRLAADMHVRARLAHARHTVDDASRL